MQKITLDTSVLLGNLQGITKLKDYKLIIPSVVLEELDGLKDNQGKGRKAQQAIKFIYENKEAIEFVSTECFTSMPSWLDAKKSDNKIIITALETKSLLYTLDIGMKIKAMSLDVDLIEIELVEDKPYTGYLEIKGDTDAINDFFTNFEDYNLNENQYVLIHDISLDSHYEYRYINKELKRLTLPDTKVLKALNNKQRCALDLLLNPNIPVKIIQGTYGSGKTYLAVKSAMHMINEKGLYNKVLFVRNPLCADGTDIGFLPGTKEEKIIDFMKPMLQYIEDEEQVTKMRMQEQIGMEVVSFMKGMNVDNTIMLVDEAEDLNKKLIKLIGTRIGKNSAAVFMGDYKQAENKYKKDNGLTAFVDEYAGNPLVGVITLDVDVRSNASKIFAEF